MPESKRESNGVGEQIRLECILPVDEQLIERLKGGCHPLQLRGGESARDRRISPGTGYAITS